MKSERKHILLRVKAALAAVAITVTLNACSKNAEVEEKPQISGSFYLVPYKEHLYMITQCHDVLNYDYRIVGYEGGSNMHEYRFYKLNGEEIGDGFNPSEVGFFHFESKLEMDAADAMAAQYGQTPVSYYLDRANETYIAEENDNLDR